MGIGVFSVTNKDDPNYWSEGSYDDWLAEMAGARLIIERFANITDGTITGVRAPFLRVGGNKQFEMMADQFFAYDASVTRASAPPAPTPSGRWSSTSWTGGTTPPSTRRCPAATWCPPAPTSWTRTSSPGC